MQRGRQIELTTDDIQSNVRKKKDCSDEKIQIDEDAGAALADREDETASTSDVLSAISKLCTFLGSCTNVTDALNKNVDGMEFHFAALVLHLPKRYYGFLLINMQCSIACNFFLIGN